MPLPITPVASNSTASASLGPSKEAQKGLKPTGVANVPRKISQQQRLLNESFRRFRENVENSSVEPLPLKNICSTVVRAR